MTEGSSGSAMPKSDLLRMAAVLAILLAVTAGVLLTSGGSGGGGEPDVDMVTGVLTQVADERLVLRPNDGRAELTFQVRPEDARRLDLFHLQEHSSRGLSTIVTYEQDGATMYATRADDA